MEGTSSLIYVLRLRAGSNLINLIWRIHNSSLVSENLMSNYMSCLIILVLKIIERDFAKEKQFSF